MHENMDIQPIEITKTASGYSRIASLFIDSVLYQVFLIPIYILISFITNLPSDSILNLNSVLSIFASILFFIFSTILFPFYLTYMQTTYNQTLGMKILGTKIVKENGKKISFGRALLRNSLIVFTPLLILLVPILGLFFSPIYLLFLIFYLIFRGNQNKLFIDQWFKYEFITANDKELIGKIFTVILICIIFAFLLILSLAIYGYITDNSQILYQDTNLRNP